MDGVQIRIEQGNVNSQTVTLNMETPVGTHRPVSRPDPRHAVDAETNLALEGFNIKKNMAATARESMLEHDAENSLPCVSSIHRGGSTARMGEATAEVAERDGAARPSALPSEGVLDRMALTKSSLGTKGGARAAPKDLTG